MKAIKHKPTHIEVVTVHVLTDADLEAKEMEAFQAGCNAAIKHCDENGFGPTTDDMYKWWKEAQQ